MSDTDNIIPMSVWNNRWKREDLLTRRSRLRRSDQLPGIFAEELREGRKYPHRLRGVLDDARYEVRYRRGNWWRLDTPTIDEPDFVNYPVRIRDTFIWILEGERRVGALTFREIDAELILPEHFWVAMDDFSDELARWAAVIRSLWEDCDWAIFGYGHVLELRNVWFEPRRNGGHLWKPVAKAMMERLQRQCSIIVAHAFPLEYNGRAPEGAATFPAFSRRQSAMVRAAGREFGLMPMPGYEASGRLWRPKPGLEEIIEPPEYDASWGNCDD